MLIMQSSVNSGFNEKTIHHKICYVKFISMGRKEINSIVKLYDLTNAFDCTFHEIWKKL